METDIQILGVTKNNGHLPFDQIANNIMQEPTEERILYCSQQDPYV